MCSSLTVEFHHYAAIFRQPFLLSTEIKSVMKGRGVQIEKGYKFTGMELEIHHTIPKYIQRALKWDNVNDCPGLIITREKHTMAEGLHSRIDAVFKNWNGYELEDVTNNLPRIYHEAGLPDVAKVVDKWLKSKAGDL